MTAPDRAALLVRAVEAIVRSDTSAVGELFTADVVAWSPLAEVSTLEALAVELEDREDAFSDVELEVRVVAVEPGHGCAEWVASATHSGPYVVDERTTIPPTGRRVTLRGVSVAEFEGGRIRTFRHYWDEIDLELGLGVVPPGEAARAE
jgi:ketosteroid isomerase-like protein